MGETAILADGPAAMPAEPHARSFYAATAEPLALPASEAREADVAIIGGGLAGLTAARELAATGKSVLVLEANRAGWGASGRNGGFVSPGYAGSIRDAEKRLGLEHAKRLWDLSVTGVDYVRDTLRALGRQDLVGGHGWLKMMRHPDAAARQRHAEAMRRDFGMDYEYWPTAKVREHVLTTRYHDALHDPKAFHIHPLNYAQALAGDAAAKGAAIREGVRVARVEGTAGAFRLSTSAGEIRAASVVHAASTYGGGVVPRIGRAILPVATYMIASETMPERLAEAIRFTGCLGDSRRAGDYYRVFGGRLLWGGRITTQRGEPARLGEMLKADILRIYPQLGDFRVDHAWSGLMGYPVHKMPLIGEFAPGLWAATGFGGHGLNTSATGGLLVASAIAHGDDRWKLFAPYRARWGGGPLGRAATQLEYWRLQLLDRIEEGRG